MNDFCLKIKKKIENLKYFSIKHYLLKHKIILKWNLKLAIIDKDI